jgi:hypothetical protein
MLQMVYKILIIFAVIAILASLTVLITAWWLDTFTPVHVFLAEQGPYRISVLPEPVSPDQINEQIKIVRSYLDQQKIQTTVPVGVFYRDRLTFESDAVVAGGGWLIADSCTVDSPLLLLNIIKHPVAVAVTRINPLIAPHKTYPVLKTWIEREGYQVEPGRLVLELYHSADSIEYQVPVVKIQYDSTSHR